MVLTLAEEATMTERPAPIQLRPDDSLAAALAARAHDTSRNLIAARDLGRYYTLLDFSRRRLARLFDESQRLAIIVALGSTFVDDSLAPFLGHEIAEALTHNDPELEMHLDSLDADVPAMLDTLKELTPADLYALADAVERHQAAIRRGEQPNARRLFDTSEHPGE